MNAPAPKPRKVAADSAPTPLDPVESDRLLQPCAEADGLGLAVSGGPDSLALMRLVADWRARSRPDLPVVVFTVDHGLRPGSADEADRVAGWARTAGLEHKTLLWEGRKPAAGIQAAAREARYRLLAEACAKAGLSHLATAHHLDDQAETLLLRLARGSGVDGLSAMPELTQWPGLTMVRPLLDTPRARLVATLEAIGQPWIEDPSNDDPRFARARLRKLMPALAEEGMTARRLADTAQRLRRARTALEATAAELHNAAVSEDAAGFCRLDRAVLAAAPEEIGLRVLARLLMGVGGSDYPPRLDRLERLYGLVTDDLPSADWRGATLSGCRVMASGADVLVVREMGRDGLPVDRFAGSGTMVWDRRFRIGSYPDSKVDGSGSKIESFVVRALGVDGVARIREDSRLRDIPLAAARAAPGVFAGDRLVAAPLVERQPGTYSPPDFAFAFLGGSRFAAAAARNRGNDTPAAPGGGELTRRHGNDGLQSYLLEIEIR